MGKPKMTAAEKAEAKAHAAAIKARKAEYKKVAKLVKSKDPVKRQEGGKGMLPFCVPIQNDDRLLMLSVTIML